MEDTNFDQIFWQKTLFLPGWLTTTEQSFFFKFAARYKIQHNFFCLIIFSRKSLGPELDRVRINFFLESGPGRAGSKKILGSKTEPSGKESLIPAAMLKKLSRLSNFFKQTFPSHNTNQHGFFCQKNVTLLILQHGKQLF